MKKKYIFWGLLACVMASCSNDEIVEKTGLNHYDITVTAVLNSKARVSFEADGDVTHAYWDEGDQITIYDESQGGLDYELTSMDEGGGTAAFAPLGNSVQYTEGTVYAIYPATPVVDGIAAIPNTDVWEEGKPMPFAYAANSIINSTLDLNFKHVFAYLDLTLTAESLLKMSSSDGDKTIHRIVVKSSSGAIGVKNGVFDVQNQSVSIIEGSETVDVVLKTGFNPMNESERNFYVPILPITENAEIDIYALHEHESGCDTLIAYKRIQEGGIQEGHVYRKRLNTDIQQVIYMEENESQRERDWYRYSSYYNESWDVKTNLYCSYYFTPFTGDGHGASHVAYNYDTVNNMYICEASGQTSSYYYEEYLMLNEVGNVTEYKDQNVKTEFYYDDNEYLIQTIYTLSDSQKDTINYIWENDLLISCHARSFTAVLEYTDISVPKIPIDINRVLMGYAEGYSFDYDITSLGLLNILGKSSENLLSTITLYDSSGEFVSEYKFTYEWNEAGLLSKILIDKSDNANRYLQFYY